MTAFEDFVTEQVLAGETIIGLYPAAQPETLDRLAKWRKANGRWTSRTLWLVVKRRTFPDLPHSTRRFDIRSTILPLFSGTARCIKTSRNPILV